MTKNHKKIRRAAKSHRCYWCDGVIEEGDQYQETTLFENKVIHRHSHLKCEELIEHFNLADYDPHDELDSDDYLDAIRDRVAEVMSTPEVIKIMTAREMEPLVDKVHVLIKERKL